MSSDPQAVVVVPARWGSSRFPGKPLVDLEGKPLIQWVVEAASRAQTIRQVMVATDDARIEKAVVGFGGQAVMTGNHPSGSDRIAEVARALDCEIVVNVQGDEPLIQPQQIDLAVKGLLGNPEVPVSTLKSPIQSCEEADNPNVVKVVTDSNNRALYFSRASIPFDRDIRAAGGTEAWRGLFRHLGLYAYRREFLLKFTQMPPTPLEEREKLEQLRVLENGFPILVLETDIHSPGVDSPEDLTRIVQHIRQSVSN